KKLNMSNLTILNLALYSPDFPSNFGESLLRLGKELKLYKGRLIVCFPEFKNWMKIFKTNDIPVEIVPIKRIFDFNAIKLVIKLIRKYNIAIIHTHFGIEPQVIACISKLLCKRKFSLETGEPLAQQIVWHWRNPIRTEIISDDMKSIEKLLLKIKKLLGNLFYRFLDKYFVTTNIVISSSIKNMLLKRKLIPEYKIEIIPNGIDLESYNVDNVEDIRKSFSIKQDEILIGNISNFRSQKDHFTFLEAIKIILEKYPKSMFMLVGSGPNRLKIEEYADFLKIRQNLIFAGGQEDIKPFIKACNFTVLSSFYEGFGNVICESMALEKPVIATNIGGITDIVVDNENGFLVPLKNPEIMAEKMIRLITHPEEIEYFGKNGRKWIEKKFTIQIWVQSMISVYLKIREKN
ncbi:MAG: glycosyltransferase family 4 protein, partial [Candidatus Ratteibacteria bacterium]|nr:glycosyltransferase family 4 protein [Candidatus Ratteibacteria bacterium]